MTEEIPELEDILNKMINIHLNNSIKINKLEQTVDKLTIELEEIRLRVELNEKYDD